MDALHTFLPTIEVSNAADDSSLICYQSLIVPQIGESISWATEDGKHFTADVSWIQHEVVEGNVVNICKRVFVSVDNIDEW